LSNGFEWQLNIDLIEISDVNKGKALPRGEELSGGGASGWSSAGFIETGEEI